MCASSVPLGCHFGFIVYILYIQYNAFFPFVKGENKKIFCPIWPFSSFIIDPVMFSRGKKVLRACLKHGNMPKRRLFFRHALPIFLEIHPVFLRQIGFVWRKNFSPLDIVPFFKQRLRVIAIKFLIFPGKTLGLGGELHAADGV